MASSAWKPVPTLQELGYDWGQFVNAAPDFRLNISHSYNTRAFYLKNFHKVANSVTEHGPQRGYMEAVIWRPANYNQPFNARIMESHLSLAYFYCTQEAWNPYYGMECVRERLEAMITYLLGLQLENGMFPEYGVKLPNLAATAFFTKFTAQTLRLFSNGPAFNTSLVEQLAKAVRNAIMVVLTDAEMLEHGRMFSNQFTNVWAGGLAYLSLYPDLEIEELLYDSMTKGHAKFQSEAGFYYESDQPDWAYTLHTHNTNERYAWQFARGSRFEKPLLDGCARYYDWLAYNCLYEPDGSGFMTNCAIQSRLRYPFFRHVVSELSEVIPIARAFSPDSDAAEKSRVEITPEDIPELMLDGNSNRYTPYTFLMEDAPEWYPTPGEKANAIAMLPYLQKNRFIHQRMDYRTQLLNLYVRRESYYAAFNSGEQHSAQQRFGLGFLWNAAAGTLVQSQSHNDEMVWGGIVNGKLLERSIGIRETVCSLNGKRHAPVIGAADWPDAPLSVVFYGAGAEKTIAFEDSGILVRNDAQGNICEQIPLTILSSDSISWQQDGISLQRGDVTLKIKWNSGCCAQMEPSGAKVGRYRVLVLRLFADKNIEYRMTLH